MPSLLLLVGLSLSKGVVPGKLCAEAWISYMELELEDMRRWLKLWEPVTRHLWN